MQTLYENFQDCWVLINGIWLPNPYELIPKLILSRSYVFAFNGKKDTQINK